MRPNAAVVIFILPRIAEDSIVKGDDIGVLTNVGQNKFATYQECKLATYIPPELVGCAVN